VSNRNLRSAVPHLAFAAASVGLTVFHAGRVGFSTSAAVVETALPLALAGAILCAGWQFRGLDPTSRQVTVAAALLCGGGLYGAGFVAFIQYLQSLSGVALVYPAYMVSMAGIGGVTMATVIAHFSVGYAQRIEQARTESARARRLRKQASVLNRTLRHNLRNELQVIDGWLGAAFDQQSVDSERGYDVVRTHLDALNDASERARLIERVLRTDERSTVDLSAAVERATDAVTEEVAVTTETPPEAPARTHPEVEAALREAVANAAEHNDTETLAVDATVSLADGPNGEMWRVEVSDDGDGIPQVELDALRGSSEGPLQHGRGLGLYLIQTVVGQSDGELTITAPETDGTTVRMAFPAAERATAGEPTVTSSGGRLPSAAGSPHASVARPGQSSLD